MPYRRLVLHTVNEEKDLQLILKFNFLCKLSLKITKRNTRWTENDLHESIINSETKLVVEDFTEENHEEYKEDLKTSYKDVISLFQPSLFWRLLLKKHH